MNFKSIAACWLIAMACSASASVAVADEKRSAELFHSKVAAIFERRCLSCHHDEAAKGDFSLSTAQSAVQGGESGAAWEPGKPDESLLWQYVSGDEPLMPKDGDPLPPEELEVIRDWISQGAVWPADRTLIDKRFEGQSWWSLQPLSQPAVPTVNHGTVRTPIDAFVLDKLQQQGLVPSAEADRRTLIRRLTYDLIGLPPSPAEVDAFLTDQAPDAYERLVDRLLASPRYGERWGRHWLDTVHFGETHGFDKDKPRPNAWPYRDYVIRALNEDRPYSRFVQEQLAGDALFPDSPDAVVATGFLAAGPWDFVGQVELREGTIDKEITLSLDRDDMLMTAMSSFVSMTAHCARCHNHKFDPIPQTDYYRLQAVFAGVTRADRPFDADPAVFQQRLEVAERRKTLLDQQATLQAKINALASTRTVQLQQSKDELTQKLAALPKPAGAADSPSNGYHSDISATAAVSKWVQVDLGESRSLAEIRLTPARPTDFADTPGFGFPARYRVELADEASFANAQTLADHTDQDIPNPGDNDVVIPARQASGRYIRITATQLWPRSNDFVFALGELSAITTAGTPAMIAEVTALDSIEGGRWSKANLVDGYDSRQRMADRVAAAATMAHRQKLEQGLAQLELERVAEVERLLDPATRTQRDQLAADLATVNQQTAALPPMQQVYAGVPAPPREVRLLKRGSVTEPGEIMAPGALSCLSDLESHFNNLTTASNQQPTDPERRAALARWITDPRNLLARRSIVNRVWSYHFGGGIVETPNDFGRMGSTPTHPELLDWLAVWFLEQGESLKGLHRLIVTSAVYRQSSSEHPANAQLDAANQYLWRMNRARLDAESVRDSLLAVSGKLDLAMGGPSVQQFVFKDDHSPIYDYAAFDVDAPGSYRRGVYRFTVRSVPDPFMDCLDCADPSLLTPKRNTTLTALQALALMNNKFLVSQSKHFAARLRAESPNTAEQIAHAYQLALCRPASAEETTRMQQFIERHGLENACRALLNSNEFMFVD